MFTIGKKSISNYCYNILWFANEVYEWNEYLEWNEETKPANGKRNWNLFYWMKWNKINFDEARSNGMSEVKLRNAWMKHEWMQWSDWRAKWSGL